MDTETATADQNLSAETVISPPSEKPNHTLEPIILNPGVTPLETNSSKRNFFKTFGLLLAGWFVGNLILLSVVGVVAVGTVGSTGLVKVPLLSSYLFGKETPTYKTPDSFALSTAKEKLNQIKTLKQGDIIADLEISQDEINALLANQINTASDFPIGNQNLTLTNNEFVFTGNLIKTNAPVEIRGNVDVNSLTAKVTITEAKFGKVSIPAVLASNIVDSSLSKIGLSLSGSQIPAQSISIVAGALRLEKVVRP